MSWKSLTCVTVFCALLVGQAQAAPTLSVAGSADGANTLWTVSITPDAALLPGSMAVELSFEFPTTQGFVGFAVDGNWNENINGTVIENPGQNPYTGGITDFVESHPNVASQLGGGGDVNAIFASLGSTLYPTGTTTPQTVLTFTTAGTSGTVNWGGFIAQDPGPNAPFFDVSGTVTFPDGPNMKLFDANIDGTVNNADIDDMVLALGSPAAWQAAHPGFDILEYLDGNGDGFVNNGDIDSYIVALGNPPFLVAPTSAVPEPSTVAVLIGTMLAVVGFRRKLAAV